MMETAAGVKENPATPGLFLARRHDLRLAALPRLPAASPQFSAAGQSCA